MESDQNGAPKITKNDNVFQKTLKMTHTNAAYAGHTYVL